MPIILCIYLFVVFSDNPYLFRNQITCSVYHEAERFELKEKILKLKERIAKIGEMKQNKDDFIKAVRKFMEMRTLTAPMLRELIDRIDVHEKQGGNKCYTQEITIYYRFVGLINIPMLPEDENYKADTRIGVEVEYIPRKSA